MKSGYTSAAGSPIQAEQTQRTHLVMAQTVVHMAAPEPRPLVALSLVSNSCLLREGLIALLDAYLAADLIACYASEPSPTVPLPNPADHIVLIDGGIEWEATMAWTRYWHQLTTPARVIVIELEDSVEIILACVQAGATGCVLRGGSACEVAQAINAVRQGIAYCSPEITAHLFSRLSTLSATLSPASVPLAAPLTAREQQVLHYIAQGYSNQEIADTLVIAVRTVKHHVHNILDKLKVRHRWEAARFASCQHSAGNE